MKNTFKRMIGFFLALFAAILISGCDLNLPQEERYDGKVSADLNNGITFIDGKYKYTNIPKDVVKYSGATEIKNGDISCLVIENNGKNSNYSALYVGGNCKEYQQMKESENGRISSPVVPYYHPYHSYPHSVWH